jgi:putative methionine-R-sulfoxide reductase with GAF domain
MSHTTPTNFYSPVCIADLAGYHYQVSSETLTEAVVDELERKPDLPGAVIVKENGELFLVVTRLKLFERLGHRYGVELFLRKPVEKLKEMFPLKALVLEGHLRVTDAVRRALARHRQDMYDPIVVQTGPHQYHLLDMTTLLMAQVQMTANVSGMLGKLDHIDRMIYAGRLESDILRETLHLLRQAVPYHSASILAVQEDRLALLAHRGDNRLEVDTLDSVLKSSLYHALLSHRQPIFVPDVSLVPAWQGLEALGSPRAWLGVPLFGHGRPLGLLSIGRHTPTAFTSDEKETAQSFGQRVVSLFLAQQKRRELGDDRPLPAPFFVTDSLSVVAPLN